MRIGAVVSRKDDFNSSMDKDDVLNKILMLLVKALYEQVEVIVFPGLLGCFFKSDREYVESILRLSIDFKSLIICPGSYFETLNGKKYHSSCIIQNGRILLRQRQIYLSKWEKDEGFSRGEDAAFVNIHGFKTSLLISTDLFYPQVSRYIAMSGADLVLSPAAIREQKYCFNISPLWENVQQNLFFGVESGFKGSYKNMNFNSLSIIHAPLEMTERENGILEIERNNDCNLIVANLDNEKRKNAIKKFDVLSKLNIKLYEDMLK
ncbi:Carbon-nitrogen hydrolase [Caloramator quimbayensis]|uniref:Carbon-nitrogen hydrolase n=1 Tax=Caloramator quimbayensis TaxID=1147123 RepID=A0A1T4WJJ1_9CLOT|nr:carbon-nitrogen hydrolase family protein [Caloramator quimbayensis]SKA77492.1 Carbon-nitrogen hydrolase [Caloramator quimbayensis]